MVDRNVIRLTVFVSVITAIVVMLLGVVVVRANRERIGSYLLQGAQNTAGTIQTPASDSAVVSAVKKTNPAVVSIVVTKDVPIIERYYNTPFDLFDNFFDIPTPQYRQRGTEEREVGGGSGFFVSADGLIVTNKHVVGDKDAEYTVFTNDGKQHKASVVAIDPTLDIAVIKISGSGFPSLAFGNSKNLELGQTVIAIGNALGEFRNTVSVGVVSGLSRSIVAGSSASGETEQLDEVIQTDAAINPGNSGGPLLDLSGNVIGVNVAVAQGSQNIGFALPADVVKGSVESVKTTGKISRPFLGIRYVAITPVLQKSQNLPVDYGILVSSGGAEPSVVANSPAKKSGIVENDIILEFDGVKITPEHTLATMIRSKKVGDSVNLKVLHNKQEKTVTVVLQEYPAE
ncbi:trypsin-like peptidase domain-containing protein [Candidatus Parcubacteria bacterium]|nr:trypsin-like peptidase domain-containing protein [Candidatus Parcubacteria bacterium]